MPIILYIVYTCVLLFDKLLKDSSDISSHRGCIYFILASPACHRTLLSPAMVARLPQYLTINVHVIILTE